MKLGQSSKLFFNNNNDDNNNDNSKLQFSLVYSWSKKNAIFTEYIVIFGFYKFYICVNTFITFLDFVINYSKNVLYLGWFNICLHMP